jgi:pyruvate dehydrogenase E2 component (dihydrolipoamide acetyltransferase)
VIRKHGDVNVAVAVAIDEGLMTPVINHCDKKNLQQISAETRELAGLARDRKLQPEQMEGSTFTISNLGMFGIEEFTAIINPPNACILAVGAIRDVPGCEKR